MICPNSHRQPKSVLAALTLLVLSLVGLRAADTNSLVQFRTPLGDVVVELFGREKPATVGNFLRYVTNGVYKDMFMHRWVPNFVVQGGGFYTTNRLTTNAQFAAVTTYPNVVNEYSVGKTYSNLYGTIAMARVGGQTNSANSQWFFNIATNSFLDAVDGGFTVFGQVISGTNILNRFNNTTATNGIYILQLQSPFGELPVLSNSPTFNDLVYVDITTLGVLVAALDSKTRTVSWQSVKGVTNRVEYTDAFPPTWQTLATPIGTGARISVTNVDVTVPKRFYRVSAGP